MADFEMKVTGLKEVQKALYSYSQQLGDKVVVSALLTGAKPMLKQAKANAPVRTGRLKRAIFARKSKIYNGKRNNKVGVYLSVKSGKKRGDAKGAHYAGFVEASWTDRGGKKHSGKRYMFGAFLTKRDQAVAIAVAAVHMGAEIVKRKVGLK